MPWAESPFQSAPVALSNAMLAFLGLCLLSRFAYSLNDIFVGRLARRHDRMEVATWRGVSLGLTMAPLLIWVPAGAWARLGENWIELGALLAITACSNILQFHAARHLPFGLRAAFLVTGIAISSATLGWVVLDEQLRPAEIALGALLIASAVAAAPGRHASHEITPNIPRGAALALAAAGLMGVAALILKRLVAVAHPFLVAWAWEFGAGLVLLAPLAWRYRTRAFEPGLGARIWRIGVASTPTAIGSGASAAALTLGALGLWAAVAGTQVLFTAVLGAWWHRETVGPWRWMCFAVAAAAVSGLAMLK